MVKNVNGREIPHGPGRQVLFKDRVFEGWWVDGMFRGYCRLILDDGGYMQTNRLYGSYVGYFKHMNADGTIKEYAIHDREGDIYE